MGNEDDLKRMHIKDEGEENLESDEIVKSKSKPKEAALVKNKISGAFLVLLVLLLLLSGAIVLWKDKIVSLFVSQTVVDKQVEKTISLDSLDKNDPEVARFIKPTTGETWLNPVKDIAPQGWLKAELLETYQDIAVQNYSRTAKEQLAENMPLYKEVGSRNGNVIILVYSRSEGPGGMYYLFEKRVDGTIAAIVQPQEAAENNTDLLAMIRDGVTQKVTVLDQTTRYDSLNVPSKLAIGSGEYVQRPEYLWIFSGMFAPESSDAKTTLVRLLGSNKLFRSETTYKDTRLTNIGYYVLTPMQTKISLRYEPNQPSLNGYTFTNNASLQYRGGDGVVRYDTLRAIARGCGGLGAAVTKADGIKVDDLEQVGKSNTGNAVYELKDKKALLYTKAYEEYKMSWENQTVSFDDYVKNHGLIFMKNARGELLVYVRDQYAPAGGCAKPVVYLYPTKPSIVDVQIGAKVTISDPYYTKDGWKNVLAFPDGKLNYQGKSYESLFWEGTGIGDSPGVNSGTVVKREQAARTIRQQLAQQGLNTKESNDFMTFWESKIPQRPYIRLTWLTTNQMNALAPLKITPKPTTVIRVFLDMEGYDAPISLPAQKLSAPERRGFTVVEWGGLTSETRR